MGSFLDLGGLLLFESSVSGDGDGVFETDDVVDDEDE